MTDWTTGQVTPFAFKRTGDADFPRHIKALVLGPPKSGKGLKNGTPVRTPSGWTPVEDLREGDQVQGVDGPVTVTGVFPQGERDIYRVTTDDGGSVECDDVHLWTVHPHGQAPSTIDTPTLQEKIQKNARFAYLPMPQPIEGPETELPLDPYVMGLLLGDGGFTDSTIKFHKPDLALHDALRSLLPDGATFGEWSDQHNTARITGIFEQIRELGLSGHASWDKFIPRIYMHSSVQQRMKLLSGLLDTDGGMNGKSTCFYTSSPRLRDDVTDLVRSLGGVATTHEKLNPEYAYKGEQRMGRAAYNVSIRLPDQFGCPFRLVRKIDAWHNGTTKRPPTRRIVDIVHVGRAPSTCIKVDASDGLFIADDYIVTHNTTLISTFPNVVVADVEAGLMSIAHKNVPYVTVDKVEKLQTLLFVLRDESMRAKAAQQMGLEKIETVSIDTMDALQELFKKERLATERRTQFEMKDWGWLLDQFRELIRAFVALPMHVVLTCHTKSVTVEENHVITQPGLQGAIAEEIAGMVGFSVMMHRSREVDQNGRPFTNYALQVEGDDQNPHLGNRAMGRLSGRIEPTFNALYSAIYEGLQLNDQQSGQVDVQGTTAQPVDEKQAQPEPEPAPTPTPEDLSAQPTEASQATQPPEQAPEQAPPAGSPSASDKTDDDKPVNPAALQHVERMLTEWGFVMPDNAQSWDMGFARSIARMFVSYKEDLAHGKIEGGEEKARKDLEEFLRGVDAWQDPASTPPTTGTIDDLMDWVGDDPDRAQLALEREKAGQDRKTAKSKLEKVIEGASAPAPVDTSTPPEETAQSAGQPDTPPDASGQASETLSPEEMDATVKEELGAEVVDETPAPTPEPESAPASEGDAAQGNGQLPPKNELMRIEDIDQAPPCEATGKPIDDLDIAKLALSRFGQWLSVDAYIAATNKG